MERMHCSVPWCRCSSDYIYYGKLVCRKHFEKHCDGVIDLKKILKVSD